MSLPRIHSIWIGPTLPRLSAACLKSFVNTGHEVVLHTYEKVENVPAGIAIRDAAALLPVDRLVQYPGGSFALSANLMRYQILARGLGLYVDADVYCWRPIEDAPYIFGLETNQDVNNAVLKLPMDSPALIDLCAIREGWSPPWAPQAPQKGLADYDWGTTGPRALTYYLKKHQQKRYALPIDTFYPVHHQQTGLFLDKGLSVGDLITSRTRYIHFYWSRLSRQMTGEPPPRSVAGQLIAASGIPS
jgi:hypothetical protein